MTEIWCFAWDRESEEGEVTKDQEETLSNDGTHFLDEVMVLGLYKYVRTYQIVYFNYMQYI